MAKRRNEASATIAKNAAASSMKRGTTATRATSGSKRTQRGNSAVAPTPAKLNKSTDWRADTLTRVRALIQQAHPGIIEEIKWRKPSNAMAGVPVWSHGGIICTGETYKNAVKLTFAKGASLEDLSGLFNASLEGSTRRAIDIHESDKINAKALKALIRAAVALNTAAPAKGGKAVTTRPARVSKKAKRI